MKVIVKEEVLEVLDLTKEEVISAVERHYKIAEISPEYSLVSFDNQNMKVVVRYYMDAMAQFYNGYEMTPMAVYAHINAIAKESKKKASTAKKASTKKVVKKEDK